MIIIIIAELADFMHSRAGQLDGSRLADWPDGGRENDLAAVVTLESC